MMSTCYSCLLLQSNSVKVNIGPRQMTRSEFIQEGSVSEFISHVQTGEVGLWVASWISNLTNTGSIPVNSIKTL